MHREQRRWCEEIKSKYPEYFEGSFVLDVGSLDVNGTNRYLFSGGLYVGIDVLPGPGVDIVSPGHLFVPPSDLFDVVISTNALEHDVVWYKTIHNMVRCLRHGGLLIISCAYAHREHGTPRTTPNDSATSQLESIWSDHYQNLRPTDVFNLLPWEREFATYMLGKSGRDLRLWGIKR
jgi:SAM-dependent methyltransferase